MSTWLRYADKGRIWGLILRLISPLYDLLVVLAKITNKQSYGGVWKGRGVRSLENWFEILALSLTN